MVRGAWPQKSARQSCAPGGWLNIPPAPSVQGWKLDLLPSQHLSLHAAARSHLAVHLLTTPKDIFSPKIGRKQFAAGSRVR